MIIIKKEFNVKKIILIVAIAACAIGIDIHQQPIENHTNIQEARFLGIGKKKTPGPCNDLGYRVVENKFTVFGIRVGKKWYTEEVCNP